MGPARSFFLFVFCLLNGGATLLNAGDVRVATYRPADSRWIGVGAAGFELYTTNSEQAAEDTLRRLETVEAFFQQAGWLAANGVPLRIVAFSSEQEYRAFRVNAGACAYYQRTRRGDYIVMEDLAPEHYEVALHEYTHFVFEHSGLKLPIWLSEGLADFYSSLEANERQWVLGRAPGGRMETLQERALLPLATLFAVGPESPFYNQRAQMMLFYGESWGLTHMLAMSPSYAPRFRRFLQALSDGNSAAASFALVYRKDLDQVAADLSGYLRAKSLPVQISERREGAGACSLKALAEPRMHVELALAELTSANPQAGGATESTLRAVSERYAASPEIEESLGYLAVRQNRLDEARAHFAKAVARNSTNPEVIFYLAHLEFSAGAPVERSIALLERALALDPGNYNARLELGLVAAQAKQFELAAAMLTRIATPHAEHSYVHAYTLAYCYAHLHQPAEARLYGERAKRAAAGHDDELQVDALLRYIDQESTVMAER